MPADNQVVLEGIAKFEALQRAVQQLVADAEGQLGKLGRNHPLVVDVAAAQARIAETLTKLRSVAAQADRPAVLRVRTDEAEARVAALSAQVKQLGVAVTDFGPPDPLGRFRASVNQASATVSDFVTRTTAGSAKFGQGFDQAATRSKLALESLQREIRDTAAAGSPIPPAVVAQVDRLETEYRQATTAAHNFRVAQAGVRAEIRSTTPPINDLAASVNRAAGAVKAFVVARAIQELGELGGASFTASEQLKAIHRQFEAIFGERADEEFAFVRAEANRLGLELQVTADQYVKVAAGAKASGLQGQELRRVFTQISEGAVVSRLSTSDYNLVLRAFSQILGGTTTRAEELTIQLRDTLPQSFAIAQEAARRVGIEADDFRDALSRGLLGSAEFAREFGNVWQEQVGKKVPEATDAATAKLARFNTAAFEARAAAGDKLSPALGDLADDFRNLLVDGRGTIDFLGTIAGGFVRLAQVGLATGDVTRNALKGIALAVQGLTAQLVPGGATFADLFDTAKERLEEARIAAGRLADIVTGKAEPALRDVAAAADDAGDSAGDAGGQFTFMQRAVAAGIKEVEKLAAALPETGEVQEAVANKIVKAIDKQLIAIRSLPVAEQAAFTERAAALEALRERLEVFTTKYIKEQAKQEKAADALAKREAEALKSRSEGFESFLQKIRDLGKAAIAEAQGEAGGAEIRKQLDEARAELAGLESKPLQSGEDVGRIDQLRETIRGLDRDLQKAGQTGAQAGALASAGAEHVAFVAGEATKAFKAGILEAVAGSKEFLNLFARLGPAGREEVEGLTRSLLGAADAGQLTAHSLEGFANRISVLAEQSGTVVSGFVERIKALGGLAAGTVDPIGTAFGALRQQVDELSPSLLAVENAEAALEQRAGTLNPALGGTTAAVSAAKAALDAFLTPAERLAQHVKEAGFQVQEFASAAPSAVEAADGMGDGFIQASDKAATLDGQAGRLVSAFEAVNDTTNRTSDGVLVAGDRIVRFGEQAVEAGGTLTTAGGEIIKLKGAGEEAAEGMGKGAEGAQELADGAERAAAGTEKTGDAARSAHPALIDFGDAAGKAGAAAADGAKGVSGLGTAAGTAVEPMGALAERVKAVTGVDLPKFFGDTAEQVVNAAEGATDLAEGIGDVGDAVETEKTVMEELRDLMRSIKVELAGAKTEQAAFRAEIEATIEPCKQLVACLQAAAAA